MALFLNYVNGLISINSYRKPVASSTDVPDIIEACIAESSENLTACLDIWVNGELNKISLEGLTKSEAEAIIITENDFVEHTIEGIFGLSMSDYPELRDIQRDYIEENFE